MTGAIAASLRQAIADLDSLETRWALIGGFAVSARAEPRFTHDVDFCVTVENDAQAEQLAHHLAQRGYALTSIVEHEYVDRMATMRLVSPLPGGAPVDLLFASSGVEPEIVAAAEPLEIVPGQLGPVALAAHLAVLKLLARDDTTRPQDAMDLRALRVVLTREDEIEVRRVAALVTERGFNRERDLPALAEEYLGSSRLHLRRSSR